MHGLTPLRGMLIGRWAWHISHRLCIFLIKKALMYVCMCTLPIAMVLALELHCSENYSIDEYNIPTTILGAPFCIWDCVRNHVFADIHNIKISIDTTCLEVRVSTLLLHDKYSGETPS